MDLMNFAHILVWYYISLDFVSYTPLSTKSEIKINEAYFMGIYTAKIDT